jgi:hypothetical protein
MNSDATEYAGQWRKVAARWREERYRKVRRSVGEEEDDDERDEGLRELTRSAGHVC